MPNARLGLVIPLTSHSKRDVLNMLQMKKSVLSEVVSTLVRKDLVEQTPAADDQRQRLLTITPAGRKLWRRLPDPIDLIIANAVNLALTGAMDGHIVNIVDEAPTSIYELVELVGEKMEPSSEPLPHPWYLHADGSRARRLGFKPAIATVYQAQREGALQACFGTDVWPEGHPIPQVSIEFELESAAAVATAVHELEAKGFTLLHGAKTEPWRQIVARLLTIEAQS